MELLQMGNAITVRSFIVKEGKFPSSTILTNFFSDYRYPKNKSGWSYGFIAPPEGTKNRVMSYFVAEVGFNIPSLKIIEGEVTKSSIVQKRIEMIGVQISKDRIEIIGTKPQTITLLLSLIKENFKIVLTPMTTKDDILANIFEASLLIRNVRAQTKIGKQEVVVGLRSGEKLEEATIAPVFHKGRNFLAIGGLIRLPTKRIVSYQCNSTGANIFYSSKMYPVKWQDIAVFMDTFIYRL